ncbi:hypothetical protein V492_02144 [Pseudogymnoascus sp. VKM F-4246]|nr:hypothetical protein V492_02144 [Pseudogymnoascus sp. VKM F-4246]
MAAAEVLPAHAMHAPTESPALALYPGAVDAAHYQANIGLTDAPLVPRSLAAALAPAATETPAAAPTSSLDSLPTELHLLIFSSLDPIDSTCLGLASRHYYSAYRSTHPVRVPLNQRRRGPNKIEQVWGILGPVSGCNYCSGSRCELHMHIREFMPGRYEYCAVRDVFGLKAREGSGEGSCFRSNPPKPMMCGRHWVPHVEEPAVEANAQPGAAPPFEPSGARQESPSAMERVQTRGVAGFNSLHYHIAVSTTLLTRGKILHHNTHLIKSSDSVSLLPNPSSLLTKQALCPGKVRQKVGAGEASGWF